MLFTIFSNVSAEKPSSMINPAESARGFAPITETSLMVPQTAREPISPPGKISGCTV